MVGFVAWFFLGNSRILARVKFGFAESPPSVGHSMGEEMCGFPSEIKGFWPREKFSTAESPLSVSLSMEEEMCDFP